MRLSAPKPLIAVFLCTGLLFQASAVFASQKIADLARYNEMISADARSLSPSELSLVELQREREDLLRNRSKESPRIFKNKLTILNNKIDYLEEQIRRIRPQMVKQRLVPKKDKAPVRLVAWRNAASQETRSDASQITLPPIAIQTQGQAPPQARLAQPQTKPIPVGLRPASSANTRENSQRLPIPAAMTGAVPSLERAPAENIELSKGKAPKTGAQWKEMSRADKEIYILSVMGNLSRRDVYLMKPYNFYIQNIDEAIKKNPQFEQEYVHRILMVSAYESEPDMRKDLEKVW